MISSNATKENRFTKINNKNIININSTSNNNSKKCIIEPCNYNKQIIVTDTLSDGLCNGTVTCWWCRIHEIRKDRACFIPLQYDEQRQIYTKSGYFCSWECVKAYNFEINDSKKTYRLYLIHTLCKRLYGTKQSQQIKHAKHWATLKQYGGNTDAQFFFQFPKTTLDDVNFDLFPFLTKKHQQNQKSVDKCTA